MKKIKKIVKSFFIFRMNEKYKNEVLNEENLSNILKSKNIFKINTLYDSFNSESIFLLREKKEMLYMLLLKTPDSVYNKALSFFAGFIYEDLPEELSVITERLLEKEDWSKLTLIKNFVNENYRKDINDDFLKKVLFHINNYFIFIEENNLNFNSYERRKIIEITLDIINKNNLASCALSSLPLSFNSDIYSEILYNINNYSGDCLLSFSKAEEQNIILNIEKHIKIRNSVHKNYKDKIFIENLSKNLNIINERKICLSNCLILAFFDNVIPYLYSSLNNNSTDEDYRDTSQKFKNIITELNKNMSFTKAYIDFVSYYNLYAYSRIKVFIKMVCLGFIDDKEFNTFISSQEVKKILKINQKINTWGWIKDFKFFHLSEEKEIEKSYQRSMILHKLINKEDSINNVEAFLKEFFCLDKATGIFLIEKIIKEYKLNYHDLFKSIEVSKETDFFYLGYIKSRAEKEIMTHHKEPELIRSEKKRL